ncbi:MAG: VanZ family protein, partial [Terriglobia bacterium]
SALTAWLAAGQLMSAAAWRPARLWILLSLLLIPAQVFVLTRQPSPAEWAGALAGAIIFCVWGARPAVAWFFIAILVVRGLAPFQFTPSAQPFTWIPFQGFLETSWQAGIRFLLEKVFYYGACIWLLQRLTAQWWQSVALTSAVLLAIEVAQRWLPGRTPEVTDPLLAIVLGVGLWALRESKERHVTLSNPD